MMMTTSLQGLQCTEIPSSFSEVILLVAEPQIMAFWLSQRFLKLCSCVEIIQRKFCCAQLRIIKIVIQWKLECYSTLKLWNSLMYPHIRRVPRYIVKQQKRKDAEQCAVFKNKYYEIYKKGPCIQWNILTWQDAEILPHVGSRIVTMERKKS